MIMKLFAKRVRTVALSLIMVLGLMPVTVFADGQYIFPSNSQSGDNNSFLRYYLTDENAGDITISEEKGYVRLNLSLDEGWYFEKWDTYFNGYEDIQILSDPEVKGNNPVNDEGYYTFFNRNGQKQPFINLSGTSGTKDIMIAKGTGFYGDHRVTAVLKPIVTVNADAGVSYVLSSDNSTTVSANQTAVQYKDDVKITYTIDDKYVLTDVNASGTKDIVIDNGIVALNDTERPTSVGIHARLKQQKVKFDANGGSGEPSTQIFEYGVAQTLKTNCFTKDEYIFAGWNTKQDGSGTSYADGQSVAFAPANDGDNITLYAQWTKTYDVYVGGVQVTEANKSDVFGDGKVSYDVETDTITLNNYTYEGDGYQYGSYENDENGELELYSAAIYSKSSIIIKLEGNNTIKNLFTDQDKHQYGDGVVTEGDLTFTGDGYMGISAAYSIEADEMVIIDDGTLELYSTDDGIVANDVVIRNSANVMIQASCEGIIASEGNVTIEDGADVLIEALRDGIYANKDIAIADSSVKIDADGDGIYSYDGNVVIGSTKTNISASGSWIEGTKVSINADGDYGIFAYNGLTVDKKLTVSSPENGSVGELTEKDYTYGTIVVDSAAAKEIVIEPLGYTVTITGLENKMAALVPAEQSLNDTYCAMHNVEDFSEVLNTEKDGYTFGGWYTDEACTEGNEFRFNDPVNGDITIYAKWVSVDADDDTEKDDNKPSDNTQDGKDTEKGDNKTDKKPAGSTKKGNGTKKVDNKSSRITAPDTGDSSNIWLWFTFLFISGNCLLGFTLNECKKRRVTKR